LASERGSCKASPGGCLRAGGEASEQRETDEGHLFLAAHGRFDKIECIKDPHPPCGHLPPRGRLVCGRSECVFQPDNERRLEKRKTP